MTQEEIFGLVLTLPLPPGVDRTVEKLPCGYCVLVSIRCEGPRTMMRIGPMIPEFMIRAVYEVQLARITGDQDRLDTPSLTEVGRSFDAAVSSLRRRSSRAH